MKAAAFIVFLRLLSLLSLAGEADVRRDVYVIQFPAAFDSTNASIYYEVVRASGKTIKRDRIAGLSYTIDITDARGFKGIVVSPNYETVLINKPAVQADFRRKLEVRMRPLPCAHIVGRIQLPANLDGRRFNVHLIYSPIGSMIFMGRVYGAGFANFEAGSAALSADGSFDVAVPDVAHDPVERPYINQISFWIAISEKAGGMRYMLVRPGRREPVHEVKAETHYEYINLEAIKEDDAAQ